MTVQRKIIGFHQDEAQDGVADLACGHTQHVRHTPPWVVSPEGRRSRLGYAVECKDCEQKGLDHGVGHFRPLSITRQRHLLAYHGTAMSHEGLCQVF